MTNKIISTDLKSTIVSTRAAQYITYQTFFYYGRGWNPNKVMKGGIKGGFIENEIFSKDNPQKIYSGVLSYILQLQQNGNFQTKGSNENEIF